MLRREWKRRKPAPSVARQDRNLMFGNHDRLRLDRQLKFTNFDSPVTFLSSMLSTEARHLLPIDCS